MSCCLAATSNGDSLGLGALLGKVGDLFHKDNGDALQSTGSAAPAAAALPAPEPAADAKNTAGGIDVDDPQRENAQDSNKNKDAAATTPSNFVASASATAATEMLDGLGVLGSDNTADSSDMERSLDQPRSVETVVHTQILVVAPDRVQEVVVSELQSFDEMESNSAADHLFTLPMLLLLLIPPTALSLHIASV
ncbi:hypothetical protein GGI11_001664 [Coemansia sp. RSA 2049]|nr:hypothetical protein H4217_003123 [Coemansia sp. RSA 1939]KAJ2522703.1 hypothetical protein GGI11_001664 [Coemansia sp. RSA 2049]